MRVGLIFGGKSTEREISIKSACEFSSWIDYNKYTIVPIYIDDKGTWNIGESRITPFNSIEEIILQSKCIESINLLKNSIDIAIPLLSGVYGEDGTIQGVFEMIDLPYTGNTVESSAISMNKILTKRLMKTYGVNMVKDVAINIFNWRKKPDTLIEKIEKDLKYPLFIKPA